MSGLRLPTTDTDGLREELSPEGRFAGIPSPLGVPMGVPDERVGMLGSGGVPANCARSSRADGEPDMPVVLGLSLTPSPAVLLFAMSTALDGDGVFDDEDIVLDDGGSWREREGEPGGSQD